MSSKGIPIFICLGCGATSDFILSFDAPGQAIVSGDGTITAVSVESDANKLLSLGTNQMSLVIQHEASDYNALMCTACSKSDVCDLADDTLDDLMESKLFKDNIIIDFSRLPSALLKQLLLTSGVGPNIKEALNEVLKGR